MYLSYYGLKEQPFRLTPDPKFLQLAEPHRDALTMLVCGVLERRGLMVVSGAIGTGKTTILNGMLSVLARREPRTPLPTALLVNPRLTADELLEMLLIEFEVSCISSSRAARLNGLQRLLFSALANRGTSLLVVDEAHLLSKDVLEEIRLLMNMESYGEKLLQVVLCGQPELLQLLNEPELRALRQRIAQRAVLRALSKSEMRMYIGERMRTAGLDQALPFTAAALDRVYACSGGVPRLINLICDACLRVGAESQRRQIGDDVVEEAAIMHAVPVHGDSGECEAAARKHEALHPAPLPPLGELSQVFKATGRGEL